LRYFFYIKTIYFTKVRENKLELNRRKDKSIYTDITVRLYGLSYTLLSYILDKGESGLTAPNDGILGW